jgi:hypothetical protein
MRYITNGVVPADDEYGEMITPPRPDIDDVGTYDQYLNAEFIIHQADGETKKNNERIILCPISLLDVNSRPRHCTLARADKLLSVGV